MQQLLFMQLKYSGKLQKSEAHFSFFTVKPAVSYYSLLPSPPPPEKREVVLHFTLQIDVAHSFSQLS